MYRQRRFWLLLACWVAMMAPAFVTAVEFQSFFNTGVDDEGNALGDGVDDPHYEIILGPSGEPLEDETVPNDGFPIPPWIENDAASRWIAPPDINGATDATYDPGNYFYQTSFDLPPDADPAHTAIVGWWAVDDLGGDILLNGIAIPSGVTHGFTGRTWFAFNSASAASAGTSINQSDNMLVFQVENGGVDPNPTGCAVNVYSAAVPLGAKPIPGLFNTGVGDDGLPLAPGSPDPHYFMTVFPDGAVEPATALEGPPVPPWVDNSSSSQWIGPNNSTAGEGPPGNYEFLTGFDMTGLDPATAVITGLWSVDNDDQGLGILLNGTETGNNQVGSFPELSRFSISASEGHIFDPGLNTLTFPVFNAPPDNNPAGVRVEGLIAYAMPLTTANCDFTGNGACQVEDIDLLVGEIVAGTNDPRFDLTGDGAVNQADLDEWRSVAAIENGWASAYLVGDSDLNGSVDAGDLNAMALRWQQEVATWSGGDFSADGFVDAQDLNGLALNWQSSIARAARAVPEASSCVSLLTGLVGIPWLRRRR